MKKLFTLFAVAISLSASAQSTLYFEDFEGGSVPPGWTQITNASDGGWLWGDSATLSSQYYTIPGHTNVLATNDDGCDCDKLNDYLISPSLDLSLAQGAFLKFDVFYRNLSYNGVQESAVLEVSPDDGATWDTIAAIPGDINYWSEDVLFNLSAYSGLPTVKIAWHYNDGGDWLYGCAIDNVFLYEPPDFDAYVVKILAPNTNCTLTNSEVCGIRVKNFGIAPIDSIPVTYSPDGFNEYVEVIMDTLWNFGDSIDYYFSQTADLSGGGVYDYYAFSSLPTDQNLSNDSVWNHTVYNVAPDPLNNALEMGFEDVDSFFYGWTIVDNNNDNKGWVLDTGLPNTGDYHFTKDWSATMPADEWFFSRCLDLDDTKAYLLDFQYQVSTATFPEKLKVTIGGAADPSAQTTISDLGELTNDAYALFETSFTVPSSGTYHVGWNCYSDADMEYLLIDDIHISELPAPNANFSYVVTVGLNVNYTDASSNFPSSWDWDFGDGSTGSGASLSHVYASTGAYLVCMTATNASGSDSICKAVNVNNVGIEDQPVAPVISVFPNPANEKVYIDAPDSFNGNITITLTDMLGRTIAEFDRFIPNGQKTQVDVRDIPTGVYMITLQAENLTHSQRMMIAH